jgi:DNA-binding LytR/AlgR family response regulator
MWIRIRAVIIEDEPLAAQYLAELLDDTCQVQFGRHAVVNLQAIEHVTHYGDRLYRVRLRDRVGTEITASRTGAARLAAVLKTHR